MSYIKRSLQVDSPDNQLSMPVQHSSRRVLIDSHYLRGGYAHRPLIAKCVVAGILYRGGKGTLTSCHPTHHIRGLYPIGRAELYPVSTVAAAITNIVWRWRVLLEGRHGPSPSSSITTWHPYIPVKRNKPCSSHLTLPHCTTRV